MQLTFKFVMRGKCENVIPKPAGWFLKQLKTWKVSLCPRTRLLMFPLKPYWHILAFVLGRDFKFLQEMIFFDFASDTNWTPLNLTPHRCHIDNTASGHDCLVLVKILLCSLILMSVMNYSSPENTTFHMDL